MAKQMRLVDAIQRRVAVVAVGPSTVRGQSVSGVAVAARTFLASLSLDRFATSDSQRFRAELDDKTFKLQVALPKGARAWGLPRKCLNIFLRDAFYNHYLRERCALIRAEPHFELPLDGIVAVALRNGISKRLPRWPGVKHLTPTVSDDYQNVASELAAQMQIPRVHLDTYLWVDGR